MKNLYKRNKWSARIGSALLFTFHFSLLTSLTSCSDLLDQAPYGTITSDQINEESVDGLLASAYAGLEAHYFGNNEAFAGPSTNWIFDVRSDDALKGGGATSMEENIHQLEISNLTSDNVSCLDKWKNNFYAISRVHKAMLAISATDNPGNLKEQTAELKFLRAFYYFDLIKVFKHIPYLTEDSEATQVNNTTYSQNAIYDFIIKDLKEAYTDIDAAPAEESKRNGHATKEAVAALLAKVYAQRSSVEGGSVDWKEVKYWCEVVINSGKFHVYDNCGDMAKMAFNNRGESIFALQTSTANNNLHINWSNLLNCTYSDGNLYGSGDDFFLASQNLVNAFRTNSDGLPYLDGAPAGSLNVSTEPTADGQQFQGNVDPRLDYTVGRKYIPWKSPDGVSQIYNYDGVDATKNNWSRAKGIYGEYSGKKFLEAPGTALDIFPWGQSGLNFIFLRYSDILLLYAEALIEQGDLEAARARINEVRSKAIRSLQQYEAGSYTPIDLDGMTANYVVKTYPAEGWSQDKARKAVRMERRIELAMEGQRWFDLLRWGTTEQTMNQYYKDEAKVHSYLDGSSVTKDELYFPVPLEEITNSNGLYSDPEK